MADPTALDRRDLMKLGAAGIGSLLLEPGSDSTVAASGRETGSTQARRLQPAPASPLAAEPLEIVRIGFVGVGGMGSTHCRNLLRIDGVEIRAVCDIVQEKVARVQDWVEQAGQRRPTGYSRGELDFVRLCEQPDLDLVFTATPWRWHLPVCVAAMEHGKHAATEVPAALTIDECWQLVETAEQHEKHCVMMENVCYGRSELMVLNMARQGVLGDILHGECGYLHDLREVKFSAEGEGLWRRAHSRTRNGNLYPTHGLGPIANCMDIQRGDRFDYLVSMSGPSRGLQDYAQEHFAPGSPQRREEFRLGDINVSLIKTGLGRTIFLSHDTNLPRPYSRINLVQGTRGIFQGYPDRLYVEGWDLDHRWVDEQGAELEDGQRLDLDKIRRQFEHPLWRQLQDDAQGGGHGGMDFIESHRLIECLRAGIPTDMNVYDAATLSVVSELTERSVAAGSTPISFPDFTRGRWRSWPHATFGSSHHDSV